MRELQTYLAKAGTAVACAVLAQAGFAQTSFESTNNPRAGLTVDIADGVATVEVRQSIGAATYQAVSPETVLRDERTGIAYSPSATRRTRDDNTQEEVYELSYALPAEGLRETSLIDTKRQHEHLYFTSVKLGGL